MNQVLKRVQRLVDLGEVRVSAHGFDELVADDISFAELLESARSCLR